MTDAPLASAPRRGGEGPAVLFVGEDNPYTPGARGVQFALYPVPRKASGNRLRLICGLHTSTYLDHHYRTNLCPGPWSWSVARERAAALVQPGQPWSAIVCCGRKVATAMGFKTAKIPSLVSVTCDTGTDDNYPVVLMPHPSGRSRAWNDPGMVRRVRSLLKQAAPGVPWGER